jgi:predicted nucleotidyltransferase
MKLSGSEIRIIAEYFRNKPVLRAFLFGSFSREEAEENSDVDILVELDYTKHIGLGFVDMKLDLENRLHKKIDLVSINAVPQYFLPFIDDDKKLIYER